VSNEATRLHRTLTLPPARGRTRRILRLGAALGCGAVLGLALSGCGGGSGGGASTEPRPPAATTAIDLPPGQTSATLGWAPSLGPVENYLVLQARNGGAWTFLARVDLPRVEVRGQPGDEIQVMTIAEGSNGGSSDPSPPSPILRFRPPSTPPASTQAAAVVAASSGSSSLAEPIPTPDAGTPEAQTRESATGADRADAVAEEYSVREDSSVAEDPASEDGSAHLSLSLRERLLRADLRFAVHRLSPRAAHWLAERVANEPTAGLTLIGSGRRDGDAWSELVWRDAAGQLFVSDGAGAADREDLRETLEEAIRLGATERFVGLADLDGDAVGDWLIEETTTGEVWMIDGATSATHAALGGAEPGATRLVGHGDFDGDGRVELVWRREDDTLFLAGGHSEAPALAAEALSLSIETLLAIADFDGDGLDDLSIRDAEGRLELLLSRPLAGLGIRFDRLAGPEPRVETLDLLASLDLDGDGASELVWLGQDALEVWDARRGPLATLGWTGEGDFEERSAPTPPD